MGSQAFALFGLTDENLAGLVYLAGLLILVGGGLRVYRNRLPQALRQAAIWIIIFLVMVTIYAYRGPLLRFAGPVLSELNPDRAVVVTDPDGNRTLTVARSSNGHFYVKASIEGTPIRFLIDTGATGTVLSERDAVRVGIAVDTLTFNRPVQTANGLVFEARTRIGRLEIGPFALRNVSVGVLRDSQLNTSLLGMNVLSRFASFQVEGDRLILTPVAE
ncbi:MAG: TIGR02281 family clan AA aspartic protease [Alphaproteobacteria bacterium]|nr:MAG: TIGR02281 family clan AA aspartic protease [Alphaproteobacteria bacterium]